LSTELAVQPGIITKTISSMHVALQDTHTHTRTHTKAEHLEENFTEKASTAWLHKPVNINKTSNPQKNTIKSLDPCMS